MAHSTTASTYEGGSVGVALAEFPDQCPQCHAASLPQLLHVSMGVHGYTTGHAAFRCPRKTCQEVFIGYYLRPQQTSPPTFYLQRTAPTSPKPGGFSDEIRKLSPVFVEVFDQAIAAESHTLHQLTGIGLRKAIEFLVKDYAKSQKPTDAEAIERAWLGVCIDTYIDDANVKSCAKLATWLGNDETHYVRKWEDKDITDLKRLVKLTVNWIENVLLTKQYVTDMTSKTP